MPQPTTATATRPTSTATPLLSPSTPRSATLATPNGSRSPMAARLSGSPATAASPLMRSRRGSPTTAVSSIMVVASSMHGLSLLDTKDSALTLTTSASVTSLISTSSQQAITVPQSGSSVAAAASMLSPLSPIESSESTESTDEDESDDVVVLKPKQRDVSAPLRTRRKRFRRKASRLPQFAKFQPSAPTPPLAGHTQHQTAHQQQQSQQSHQSQQPQQQQQRVTPQRSQQQQQPPLSAVGQKKPAGMGGKRPKIPWTPHQHFWMEQGRCIISPVGKCAARTVSGSLYCTAHACQAPLADSTVCGGPVPNPHQSRVCNVGYHTENTRDAYVASLIARRAELDARAEEEREDAWAESAAFFRRNYGEVCADSPYWDPSPLPGCSNPASPRPKHLDLPRCSSDLGKCQAGRELDTWWVGEWRFHQSAQ